MLQVGGRSAFMTFWERLESALSDNNCTMADLGRKIQLSPTVINSWKMRGSIPRADIACKTAEALNTTVEYLITGNTCTEISNSRNTFLVPILNQELSAGHGDLLPEEDVIEGLLSLPIWLRKKYGNNLGALHVHGDSMQPTLNDGDMVVCDSLGWDKSDGIFAIRLNGNGYVKRLQVVSGKVLIKSDNPNYETITEPLDSNSINVIGKVRLIIKAV